MNVDQQGLCVRVGEDAYFVRKDGLGVADGVGGWSQVVKGSNAALFSSRLMHHVAAQLEYYDDFTNEYDINEYYTLNPVKVMQVACERTLDDAGKGESRAVGSTTALIAFLRDDELRVASLGDTSLLILRNGNLIFRTEEQQHSFNFPYQLGSDSKDTPEKDAGQYAVKIREGDLVIVGSDGIFDNLFDEDILDIVNAVVMGTPSATTTTTTTGATAGPLKLQTARILRTDPQQVATAILAKAREVSLDTGPYVVSPFQERAVNEGLYYQGGKLDDLTVVVGIVGVAEDSPDRR
ncbi:phosphatase 2C-like domain-containing protein [Obelidium mucronatum]|nr:phosphatase 2C-like domain-containing protein [Obelidium mucronatum]